MEWSSPNLLAVDAADEELARTVSGWLLEQEQEGAFDEGADAGAFVGVELVEGGEVDAQ